MILLDILFETEGGTEIKRVYSLEGLGEQVASSAYAVNFGCICLS